MKLFCKICGSGEKVEVSNINLYEQNPFSNPPLCREHREWLEMCCTIEHLVIINEAKGVIREETYCLFGNGDDHE